MSEPCFAPFNVGLAPGEVIADKYRVDAFLGAGGMGVVLRATHLELGSPVAIKVVRDELAKNEAIVSSLLFEARAVARMKGTHIVRVLDVARLSSGAPYIVMELLEGADLESMLADGGPLAAQEAVAWLLQACEGLAEAHSLGIVHRDLKPENLFLADTPEGVVLKILDFGISKDLGPSLQRAPRSTLTKAGAPVGSPYYMSPEQMRASPELDARADIWALGAILFELVTGRCPFEAESPTLLCAKVMTGATPSLFEFSDTAPDELDAIVHRCLEKDPSARFQTVTELADALRSFLLAQQARRSRQSQRPELRQRRAGLPLLALSALLVCASIGFWYLQGQSLPRTAPSGPHHPPTTLVSRAPVENRDAPATTSTGADADPASAATTLATAARVRSASWQPARTSPRFMGRAEPAVAELSLTAAANPAAPAPAASAPSTPATTEPERSTAGAAPDMDSVGARYDL